MSELSVLQNDLGIWSDKTFGPPSERGPVPPLHHLAKEVQEAIAAPDDIVEYADCLLLILDAARRAGFRADDLVGAASLKLLAIEKRRYTVVDANGVVEHDRSAE